MRSAVEKLRLREGLEDGYLTVAGLLGRLGLKQRENFLFNRSCYPDKHLWEGE
jgi:hypothetical protein